MIKVIVFTLLVIVLILRFRSVRGGSKIERVIALAAVLIVVGLLAAIAIPQFTVRWRIGYDHDVRSNLRYAAKAEEAYYRDNGSYTANIGNLKGFKQGANVAISASATATTFVITGTVKEGCKAYTGRWVIDSTTGAIDGTPCR